MKEIFAILTITAPKWRRIAGAWQFSSNATFFTLQGAFRLNWENYRKYIIKLTILFSPDLHESLVGIHNFPSICLKIVATNCEGPQNQPEEKQY